MFFSFMILMSMTIFFTESTLLFALTLVLFSIAGSFVLSWMSLNWIFVAIILMFLGGMMVVFVYASSLSASKKNVFLTSGLNSSVKLFFIFFLVLTMNHNVYKMMNINPSTMYLTYSTVNMSFIASYLLLALLLFIKIMRMGEGPLKL